MYFEFTLISSYANSLNKKLPAISAILADPEILFEFLTK